MRLFEYNLLFFFCEYMNMKSIKDILSSIAFPVYARYVEFKQGRILKRNLNMAYDDTKLTRARHSSMLMSWLNAPKEFKEQLKTEFDDSVPTLPLTYRHYRLEEYKKQHADLQAVNKDTRPTT